MNKVASFIERIQAILSSLVVAGLIGIGVMIFDSNKNSALMAKDISHLNEKMHGLETQLSAYTANFYTKEEAKKDLQQVNTRIEDHEERLNGLDSRVYDMRDKIKK